MMEPVQPLIQALGLQPAGRYRVAMALAKLHDLAHGHMQATIQQIAAAAELSKVQARKHVHALIADGLLTVIGNAFGGQPGLGPSYAFNHRLLEQLAACNPDLFAEPGPETSLTHGHSYRFTTREARFLACLIGDPGARRIVFWRTDGRMTNYGDVSLKALLRDPRVQGGWHCHLLPNGNPDAPFEQMYRLTSEEVNRLATWAENAALGRTRSWIAA